MLVPCWFTLWTSSRFLYPYIPLISLEIFLLFCRGAEPQHTVVVLCVYPSVRPSVCLSVCLSVCPLDFLQDGTESAAENCNISITREYLENDGLRFSI